MLACESLLLEKRTFLSSKTLHMDRTILTKKGKPRKSMGSRKEPLSTHARMRDTSLGKEDDTQEHEVTQEPLSTVGSNEHNYMQLAERKEITYT
jgi:hypothetical protein